MYMYNKLRHAFLIIFIAKKEKQSLLCLEAFWLLSFYFFGCSLQLIIIQIFLKNQKFISKLKNVACSRQKLLFV